MAETEFDGEMNVFQVPVVYHFFLYFLVYELTGPLLYAAAEYDAQTCEDFLLCSRCKAVTVNAFYVHSSTSPLLIRACVHVDWCTCTIIGLDQTRFEIYLLLSFHHSPHSISSYFV